MATGSCAPINKLIPVEANDGKDALRAFLHKVPKEGEADTPERVKKLLRKACKEGDPEANNPAQGVSALMLAARGNAVGAVRLLLEHKADIGVRTPKGVTALSIAAEEGYEELATILLNAGADPNTVVEGGGGWPGAWSPLMVCSFNGHLETCRMMIELGADINYGDENGWTALIWAASNGHAEVIEMLNDYEAEIEFADVNGWTGLTWACFNANDKAIEAFLKHCGANPSPIAADGRTPLMFLSSTGATFGVQLLVQMKADPDVRQGSVIIEGQSGAGGMTSKATKGGWTALMWAAFASHTSVVKRLIEGGANIHQEDDNGATALLHACVAGADLCAHALIRKGARVNGVDKFGRTPLLCAVKEIHVASVRLLVQEKADPNQKSDDTFEEEEEKHGWSPLMWAVERESAELVHQLLEAGADLNAHGATAEITVETLAQKCSLPGLRDLLIECIAAENIAQMHMGAPTTKSGRLSMDADSRHRLPSDRTDSPLNKLSECAQKSSSEWTRRACGRWRTRRSSSRCGAQEDAAGPGAQGGGRGLERQDPRV